MAEGFYVKLALLYYENHDTDFNQVKLFVAICMYKACDQKYRT